MRTNILYFAAALVVAATFCVPSQPVCAAADPPAKTARKTEAMLAAEITEQLASNDPAQRQQAVQSLRARLQSGRGLYELRGNWLKQLMAARMYKEVADLTLEGIQFNPNETRSVEQVLQARIKALIALGRADEALAESKSLFNIASMGGTSEAILMVAECIGAAKPSDVDLFNRFREEQMTGATLPTTQPAASATLAAPNSGRKCTVLAGIKVNAAPYEEALKKISGEDPQSLMARGNLLLLADRVKDARAIFERMYSLGTADLGESTEALARCIKAEDGTIGRANAWVISIRPKK